MSTRYKYLSGAGLLSAFQNLWKMLPANTFLFLLVFILAAVLTFTATAAERGLPVLLPYLGSDGLQRQPVQFRVETFTSTPYGQPPRIVERPIFASGNKAVVVHPDTNTQDNHVSIMKEEKVVATLFWWGSEKGWGFGYPYPDWKEKPATLKIDRKKETVFYHKPYRRLDGTESAFSYTLKKGKKEGTVELSWDTDVNDTKKDPVMTVSLWVSMNGISQDEKVCFGEKEFPRLPNDELLARKNEVRVNVTGDLRRSDIFEIIADNQGGSVAESLKKQQKSTNYSLLWRRNNVPEEKETIILDLRKSAQLSEVGPASYGGINFWKEDRLHVPVSPTRNLFLNPSFDRGLRGWFWPDGGASYQPGEPQNKFEIVSGGCFGDRALRLNTFQRSSAHLKSFPYSLDAGKTYTLSFYAKTEKPTGLTVAISSVSSAGKFVGRQYGNYFGDYDNPDAKFKLTTEWQRYSRTFIADNGGIHLQISGYGAPVLLDGIQLEEGSQPTEFVAPPLTGDMQTSDPDNQVDKKEPLQARLVFSGSPETKGTVRVRVLTPYRETLFDQTFPAVAGETLSLPFTTEQLDEGIFTVRTDYKVKGVPDYTEYSRLCIMTPLSGTWPTRNLCGTLNCCGSISRSEDLARKYEQWGFGASSHTVPAGSVKESLMRKYGLDNFVFCAIQGSKDIGDPRKWTEVTPELEKEIEEYSFNYAQKFDPEFAKSWSLSNEEEGGVLQSAKKYDEYFKAQHAMAKGVLRANPKAVIVPTNGTSGYSLLRGYNNIEGYLAAAQKAGFKYGAVAVHPYWAVDGGTLGELDLDEEAARLIAQMERFGYGKETPIYFTELYNVPWVHLPAWGADKWADSYRVGHSPTYDLGNRELLHAASAARIWLMTLKYWPKIQMNNIWVSRPYMDLYLTPILLCKAANTMGHLLPDIAAFTADVRPAPGIRGYVYRLKNGSGVAAIWSNNHDVENGIIKGPTLLVKPGQKVEFRDLMGAKRFAAPDANGVTALPLTSAPLFVIAENPEQLAQSLQTAVCPDAVSPLAVSFRPDSEGNIISVIKNLTDRPQSGKLGESEFTLAPMATREMTFPNDNPANEFGNLYQWNQTLSLSLSHGASQNVIGRMDYFYVPKCGETPDWTKIPAISLAGRSDQSDEPGRISFQAVWNEKSFFLRITAIGLKKNTPEMLKVCFDCGANGRLHPTAGFDEDDYRYDFRFPSAKAGSGKIRRVHEAHQQFAGGLSMPTKEAASAGIRCNVESTSNGRIYTMEFPGKFIEPIRLEKGFRSGLGLFLRGYSTTDDRPAEYPLMIFRE